MSVNQIQHQLTESGTDKTQTNSILSSGSTVPTTGSAGYATGALFIRTVATGGTSLYTNQGTGSSCSFAVIP